MPTPYERLLTESDARRVLLAEITYDAGSGEEVYRASNGDWTTGAGEATPNLPFNGVLESGINVSTALEMGESIGGVAVPDFGVLELNNLDGAFNAWETYRVEDLSIRLLLVGELNDGTVVTYTDAIASPLVDGKGIGKPQVSDRRMTIGFNGALYQLRRILNTEMFSPPCPSFPGTVAGSIDFGDNFDAAGTFSWSFWVYCTDPTRAAQMIFTKDTGAAGYYLDLGTVAAGALRFGIRNQTPINTDTAAGVIQINRWHHVEVTWSAALTQRQIIIDGTAVATTSGITGGSPGVNAASFIVGSNFSGLISKGAQWSIAQSATLARADMFLPILPTTASLTALPLMEEGKGTTTADSDSGSVVTGTLGTGVTWKTSGWCGQSLAGKLWPLVLGKALRVPLTPIDPALSTFATCWPPPVAAPSLYSNHNPVSSGYTYEAGRGLVTLSGAATGLYSADLCGETMFNGAVLYDGASGYASGTVTLPAGSMFMACLVRLSATSATPRRIMGWMAAVNAGLRLLTMGPTTTNLLQFGVRNDANTAFTASAPTPLLQDRDYHVCGVLDTGANEIRLYVDAALVATVAISGTWNTVTTSFAIGRRSDVALDYLPGRVDEAVIGSGVPTIAQIESLVVAPAVAGTLNLTQIWHCDTGSGTSLVNAVGGGATLTLSGTVTWTQSRIAAADLVNVILTRYAGYTTADLDTEAICAYIRQTAADCGWMVDGPETALEIADLILRGVGSYLRPNDATGLLEMGQVSLSTGTPDEGADFDNGDMPADSTIEPAGEQIAAPYYGVNVLHAKNWARQDASQLAGILTSQPTLYQFGQAEWREALEPDLSILEDYPQAEILEIQSPLLNMLDALAESARVRPFYGPDREPYVFTLSSPALQLRVAGEMRVTVETADNPPLPVLEMGAPGRSFRVLSVTREDERVTARGLA